MSRSGGASTRVPGHTLREEGKQRWHENGRRCFWDGWCDNDPHASACSCGAVSPVGLSMHEVRRWHREHKATIRAAL